jgi:hypothetical protein
MPKHADIDEYIESLEGPGHDIGHELRAILDDALGNAARTLWHGHPVWMSGKKPLAGFKAYASHVTFMIWHGNPISDATGRLQSNAHMATVKLGSTSDIDRRTFRRWLRTAHAA